MKERVLSSKVLQTDDTPVAVLDPDLPHTHTGRIWTFVGDTLHPYTVYDYNPDRRRSGPDEFLKDFHGYLHANAYSGYDQIYKEPGRGVTEVVADIKAYLERERPKVLPKSPEGQAISYTLSN